MWAVLALHFDLWTTCLTQTGNYYFKNHCFRQLLNLTWVRTTNCQVNLHSLAYTHFHLPQWPRTHHISTQAHCIFFLVPLSPISSWGSKVKKCMSLIVVQYGCLFPQSMPLKLWTCIYMHVFALAKGLLFLLCSTAGHIASEIRRSLVSLLM